MSRLADQIERAAEGYERTLRPAWTGDNRDEMLALFNVVAANLPAILQALRDGEKMRAALRFYADRHEVPSEGPWGVNSTDFGNVARQALTGEA